MTEHLPTEHALFEVADESLPVVLEPVDAALTIEPVEEALTDAQKAFLLGKRVDAFDEEYVTETEARITATASSSGVSNMGMKSTRTPTARKTSACGICGSGNTNCVPRPRRGAQTFWKAKLSNGQEIEDFLRHQ